MKKHRMVAISFILFLIGITGVKASETLYTCTYKTSKLKTAEGKQITLKYSITDDDTVKLPFKDGEQYADDVLGMALPWNHNSGFKKSFYQEAEESGKCPTITVSMGINSVNVYLGTKTDEEWKNLQMSDWEALKNGTKKITETGKEEGIKDITKTSSCEKLIRYRVDGKYSEVNISFWMMSNGSKYWEINGIEKKANETIYSTLFNGYNASYTITEGEIDKIYSQSEEQKKNNTFTCPKNLYLNEQNSLDYLITTNPADGNSSFGEIIDVVDQDDIYKGGSQSTGCNVFGTDTTRLIKWAYSLIKYGAPILVVILGILDFAKSFLSGEDKGFKEAWQRFIKRLIAAVVVILLPVLITFILDLSGVLDQYDIEGEGNKIYCIFE